MADIWLDGSLYIVLVQQNDDIAFLKYFSSNPVNTSLWEWKYSVLNVQGNKVSVACNYVHILMLYANINISNLLNAFGAELRKNPHVWPIVVMFDLVHEVWMVIDIVTLLYWLPLEKWLIRVLCISIFLLFLCVVRPRTDQIIYNEFISETSGYNWLKHITLLSSE